jgi:hypothetical protein
VVTLAAALACQESIIIRMQGLLYSFQSLAIARTQLAVKLLTSAVNEVILAASSLV